ncbi:thrombospondin type-1 domain-containing protein 4-like [Haliotis rufescens]|uniref:thrombospondin type-1 domain-containing protein 4-like n=1 Tax=Haliotis rufescens TaxID=6454 RepID=UPI00201EC57E|nr:thrombospondin type-1 domain-containing protein 4-like [Haliotis rufescens]
MRSTLKAVTCLLFLQSVLPAVFGQSDTCLACDRKPSSCRKIAGIFMVTVLSEGSYNPVVEIPTGACRINITELALSENYLAVKTKRSKSIFNSYWSIVPTGLYGGAGTIFRYAKQSGPHCPGQCIFTDGSLNETVVVQMLFYSKNPGISYEFLLPNYIAFTPFEGTFIPQTPHTVHHRHRHRSQTQGRGQGRHRSRTTPHFEGEFNPSYNSRSEGQSSLEYNRRTEEFRAGRSSAYDRRYPAHHSSRSGTQRNYPSGSRTDTTPRRYGYDTLGGRGLSYTQQNRKTESSQTGIPIQVAPRPRYVSPYDRNGRFTGHKTLDFNAALTDRRYVRGPGDAQARSVDNEIGTRYSGQQTVPNRGAVDRDSSASQYMWRISGFTDCSTTCGGGHQETKIVCVLKSSQTQVIVTGDNCNNAIKPQQQRVPCNTNPCGPDWETDDWSTCSVTCGSGTQTRRVECKQRMSPTSHLSVSASKCDAGRRPAVAQQCEKGPCAKWKTSKWGKCSVSCGVGEQRRKVKCVDHQATQIPDRFCEATPPTGVKKCNQGTCQKQWWTSKWSDQCSNECGSGVKTRDVMCGSPNGVKLEDSVCEDLRKPQARASCRSQSACGGKWFTGPWGKCSAECGHGERRRDVVCMKVVGSAMSITLEENCAADEKPTAEEKCRTESCGSEWYMSQWSECSVTCGAGMKSRQVKCLDQQQRRARSCERSQKPPARENCQMRDCRLPQATRASPTCRDQYRSCQVVLQARLCTYSYYRKICCSSCKSAHS